MDWLRNLKISAKLLLSFACVVALTLLVGLISWRGLNTLEEANIELADKLGLASIIGKTYYDVTIIGGGPAGLTAALYLARDGYQVLIIEQSTIGGQAYITNTLDNFPGFSDGISGEEFANNLKKQVSRFGVEILTPVEVIEIAPCHEEGSFDLCKFKVVKTNTGNEILCRVVLIVTGSKYKEINVPGSEDLAGVSVHYCATCDGAFYKDKEIFVVGGGNSAYEETIWLVEKFVKKATMIIRSAKSNANLLYQDKIEGLKDKVQILYNTEINELIGEDKLQKVILIDTITNAKSDHYPDAVFAFIGQSPNTRFIPKEIKTDETGFIETGIDYMTSINGIFSAGDCRKGSSKQAIIAAGEGAASALSIREYLKNN